MNRRVGTGQNDELAGSAKLDFLDNISVMSTPARAANSARPRVNRRSPEAHKAIIDATLELLRSTRYSNLSTESIAATAGVGKATVYRWWPSKGALVAEAITSRLRIEDPPETSDFRADLIAAVEISTANYARHPGCELITALAADLAHDKKLLASFLEMFVRPRRRAVLDLVERGIREGHLARDTDPELFMDMIAGAILYRTLMRHLPVDELATQFVDAWLSRPQGPTRRGSQGSPRLKSVPK
jgi:AcrR family transcriptional regulator